MSDSWLQIILLSGWLFLAASAFASYRLSWRKGVLYALIWASIFAGVAFFISAVRG